MQMELCNSRESSPKMPLLKSTNFFDGKISGDIKENDIPAKADNLMEETKRIWLTMSTVKQNLANVRRHAATPTYTYENVHQANSFNKSFSPDSNQQRITDFFVDVSKEESLRVLGGQSDRERLELLEERLRQMEVTKKRLQKENKQLRAQEAQSLSIEILGQHVVIVNAYLIYDLYFTPGKG